MKSIICFVCQKRFNLEEKEKASVCKECKKYKLPNIKIQTKLKEF